MLDLPALGTTSRSGTRDLFHLRDAGALRRRPSRSPPDGRVPDNPDPWSLVREPAHVLCAALLASPLEQAALSEAAQHRSDSGAVETGKLAHIFVADGLLLRSIEHSCSTSSSVMPCAAPCINVGFSR